jgi:hypothetical protein
VHEKDYNIRKSKAVFQPVLQRSYTMKRRVIKMNGIILHHDKIQTSF